MFEDTELFARTSGEGSDIVSKEMYTFADRGDRSLTLRAEATAPIVRAYLQHGLHREPQPQKLFTHETIYRYGRPQKGRYREHWQLDVEAIGSDDPAVDAEVIQLYDALLGRLGVTDYRLELNSIGDAQLPARIPRAAAALAGGTRGRARRGDPRPGAAEPAAGARQHRREAADVQAVLREAPTIGEALCDGCREHFAAGPALPGRLRRPIRARPDPRARASTTTRARPGSSSAPKEARRARSRGGGRYDGLAEALGGRHTPGVGFGAGIERLLIALEQAGVGAPGQEGIDVFFVCADGADRAAVLAKVLELRAAGVRARRRFRRPVGEGTAHPGRQARGQAASWSSRPGPTSRR